MAALILVVGLLITLSVLISSQKLSTVSERVVSLSNRAQAELERVQSLPYGEVALTGTSSSWSTTAGAYTYVNMPSGSCPGTPSGSAPTYQPDHSGASSTTEPLVLNGCTYTSTVNGASTTTTVSAGVVPAVQTWSAPLPGGGTVSGNVYDFVTWTTDPTCSQTSTPGSNCATTNDYKRITVVVTINGVAQPSQPAIVSAYLTPPNTGRNPLTGGGTTCTNSQGQQVSCTGCTTQTCGTISTNPCTGSGCNVNCVLTVCTSCTPLLCPTAGSGNPPCTSMPSGAVAQSWLTQPIPAGASWNLTGTGHAALYLQANTTSVTAKICVGIFVVPGGLLSGVLPDIGTSFLATATVQNFPTPITIDFNAALGPGGYLVSNIAGTKIEVVVWVAASASPVQVVNSPPTYVDNVYLNTTSS
jgi:hypothetical protein